jgi:hypothetical protein
LEDGLGVPGQIVGARQQQVDRYAEQGVVGDHFLTSVPGGVNAAAQSPESVDLVLA